MDHSQRIFNNLTPPWGSSKTKTSSTLLRNNGYRYHQQRYKHVSTNIMIRLSKVTLALRKRYSSYNETSNFHTWRKKSHPTLPSAVHASRTKPHDTTSMETSSSESRQNHLGTTTGSDIDLAGFSEGFAASTRRGHFYSGLFNIFRQMFATLRRGERRKFRHRRT